MAAAPGIAATLGAYPVALTQRAAGSLQGFGARHNMGVGDPDSLDRDFHVHLCRSFPGALWQQHLEVGLRGLSLLRTAAMEHVSGDADNFCHYSYRSLESGEARGLSSRSAATGPGAGGPRKSIVRHSRLVDCGSSPQTRISCDGFVVTGAVVTATCGYLGCGLANRVFRRVSARHRSRHLAVSDGVDVFDADSLSGIDRSRTLSFLSESQPVYTAGAQLPADTN